MNDIQGSRTHKQTLEITKDDYKRPYKTNQMIISVIKRNYLIKTDNQGREGTI